MLRQNFIRLTVLYPANKFKTGKKGTTLQHGILLDQLNFDE